MDLGIDEIRELIELLDHSSLMEISLETADVKLALKKGPVGGMAFAPAQGAQGGTHGAPSMAVTYADASQAAATPAAPAAEAAIPAALAAERANVYLIRSPMVGTFYRAPSPDAPPFVEVGQSVELGQTVCIIEAMKLMNEIEAEHGGKIARICATNGEPVEFGQILFEVER